MEVNNEETGGALPFESTTEMGLNSLDDPGSGWFDGVLFMFRSAYPNRLGSGVIMKLNNEETADAALRSERAMGMVLKTLEDLVPGWFDGSLSMFRSAYPNRLGSGVIMEVNNEETAGALPFECTMEMGLNSGVITEVNNEETAGAMPSECTTEMGLNSGVNTEVNNKVTACAMPSECTTEMGLNSGVNTEVNNEETAGGLPSECTTEMGLNSLENPGSKLFDEVFVMFRSAYDEERATNASTSTLFHYIRHNAPSYLFFATFLFCRCPNPISLYQVFFCFAFTPLFLHFYINLAPFLLLEEDVNKEETAGALPFECTTEMGLNSLDNLGSKLFDEVLDMFRSAYDEERATNSSTSTLFHCIRHNALPFLSFATFLFCRYANPISLYQVFFCSAFTPLFLYFYINHAPFLLLEEDVKWLRRELRLLGAISKDTKEVASITASIDAKAHEIWGSEPINRLDESETACLGIAESKSQAAKYFVSTFERVEQRVRSGSLTNRICFALCLQNFLQILNLFDLPTDAKKQIDEIFVKKEDGINICKSLERSRSDVVSLRPLYQGDQTKLIDSEGRVAEVAAATSSVLKKMISLIRRLMPDSPTLEKASSVELQLLLMLPFLEYLGGSQLESEIERAWMEEAKEFITEADTSIDNLETAACKTWWLPIISRWNARRKLKGVISNIDTRFSELLERKDRYGFKFVRRDSKVVFQSPRKTIYDTNASSVLNGARKDLSDETSVLTEVLEEVTPLCDQLESMIKLVEDAGTIDGRFNYRMLWLEEARKIVQLAEKSLETFKKNSGDGRKNLTWEIGYIKQTITIFKRCINTFGIELRGESNSVVGLEEDIETLVSRLTSNSQLGFVVSITGIEGIGKTTLAKEVYNHQVIVDHYPCRAWVTLHTKSNQNAIVVEEVAEALMGSLKLEKEENCNGPWTQKVNDLLHEKRCLIVLDNISEIEEFNSLILKAELQVPSSGSRILLTARKNIFDSPADSPPHQIRLRSTKESWKLLNQMVQFPLKQEKLAKEILGKCGGLPLAIYCLGYLMSGKDVNKAEELRKVLQYIRQNDKPLTQYFTTRFIDSVPNLFSCLSYLKLFPKDFEIPARRLIALWIAEDLVKVSEHNSETYEDVAYKCLIQLIDGGVIQVVEREHNGEVKKCRLPYAVVQKLELKNMSSRRIIYHCNRSDESYGHIHGESSSVPSSYSGIVSILSFDTREVNKPVAEIGNILRGVIAAGFFQRLKVLDLQRVFRPNLPDTIGRLIKLRYLGLRWTYLQLIPSSIGDLQNLQTLDVKHTFITLPSSIWKLQKLRHLYLNQSYRSKSLRQQGGSSLKNLQTLWGVFLDNYSPLKDGMDKLLNLRKLGLEFQLTLSEQEVLSEKIVNLKHLKSLRMRSVDGMGKSSGLFLKSLVVLENLCNLYLFGKLNPPIILEFPTSLIDLTLSASSLSDDPMPKLEKLPNLKVLCFYSESFIGNKMTCSTLGFPQLVVLKLWKLENLQEWDVEEKAMQNLRELEIRSCKKLRVPSGLKHLITLNELKLTNMPEEFAAATAITRRKIWKGLNHSPAIIADNRESSE